MKRDRTSESANEQRTANTLARHPFHSNASPSERRTEMSSRDRSGRELLLWTLAYVVILMLLVAAAAFLFSD